MVGDGGSGSLLWGYKMSDAVRGERRRLGRGKGVRLRRATEAQG
jgi:hypothetical protein